MRGSYFAAPVAEFLVVHPNAVLGQLVKAHAYALEHPQRKAWLAEIRILKQCLAGQEDGYLFLEFLRGW